MIKRPCLLDVWNAIGAAERGWRRDVGVGDLWREANTRKIRELQRWPCIYYCHYDDEEGKKRRVTKQRASVCISSSLHLVSLST